MSNDTRLLCTGRVFCSDRSSCLLEKACQGTSPAGRRGSSHSGKTILASGCVFSDYIIQHMLNMKVVTREVGWEGEGGVGKGRGGRVGKGRGGRVGKGRGGRVGKGRGGRVGKGRGGGGLGRGGEGGVTEPPWLTDYHEASGNLCHLANYNTHCVVTTGLMVSNNHLCPLSIRVEWLLTYSLATMHYLTINVLCTRELVPFPDSPGKASFPGSPGKASFPGSPPP